MIRYQSSYRSVAIDEALARARPAARALGISRVTNVTRLDYVDVPVFSSVRPSAVQGSLCVNAGKGLTLKEARIGALMEAVEFAYAERGQACVELCIAPAAEVLGGGKRSTAILDLCPMIDRSIPLAAPLECVVAMDLSGKRVLVPAELVFFPWEGPRTQTFFGASTNGLASGTTTLEATVHALFEVIERDVVSFAHLGRKTMPVALHTLPPKFRLFIGRLGRRGLGVAMRWLPNEFDLPCFRVTIWEQARLDPLSISEGFGCHIDPSIALTRAFTEAAQSRLTCIHGARDDIEFSYDAISDWSRSQREIYAKKHLAGARRGSSAVDFSTLGSSRVPCGTLEHVLENIQGRLKRAGIRRILRVRLTPRGSRIAVVRVIVPLLEHFAPQWPRVGPRLAKFVSHA